MARFPSGTRGSTRWSAVRGNRSRPRPRHATWNRLAWLIRTTRRGAMRSVACSTATVVSSRSSLPATHRLKTAATSSSTPSACRPASLLEDGQALPLFYDGCFGIYAKSSRQPQRQRGSPIAACGALMRPTRGSHGPLSWLPPLLPKLWRRLESYGTDREFRDVSDTPHSGSSANPGGLASWCCRRTGSLGSTTWSPSQALSCRSMIGRKTWCSLREWS